MRRAQKEYVNELLTIVMSSKSFRAFKLTIYIKGDNLLNVALICRLIVYRRTCLKHEDCDANSSRQQYPVMLATTPFLGSIILDDCIYTNIYISNRSSLLYCRNYNTENKHFICQRKTI